MAAWHRTPFSMPWAQRKHRDDDCWCKPDVQEVDQDNGEVGYVVVHVEAAR